MPEETANTKSRAKTLYGKIRLLADGINPTPRFSLFFIAVVVKLAASALSGIGFVLKSAVFLVSGAVLWLLFFALLFLIASPRTDSLKQSIARRLQKASSVIFAIVLLLGIAELIIVLTIGLTSLGTNEKTSQVLESLEHTFAYNDATALCHQAISNYFSGKNPYAEANIASAMTEYGVHADKLTPLHQGAFADSFPYPDTEQLEAAAAEAAANPGKPCDFESRLGYPAGCFLIPAPLVMLGIGDIRLVYALIILVAVGIVLWKAPPPFRWPLAAALLVSLELPNSLAAGETGFLVFPFLLLAWVFLPRNLWFSALCLGIAAAVKQTAWFFIPFYLILVFRTGGGRKLLESFGIVAATFLVLNLPFIIDDAGLWFTSIMSPMVDKMFPLGVGAVTLVTGGLIPTSSPVLFGFLEVSLLGLACVWYFFYCRRLPAAGPILAILPLFFAWRSLWPYFFYIDFIVLAGIALNEYGAKTSRPATAIPNP